MEYYFLVINVLLACLLIWRTITIKKTEKMIKLQEIKIQGEPYECIVKVIQFSVNETFFSPVVFLKNAKPSICLYSKNLGMSYEKNNLLSQIENIYKDKQKVREKDLVDKYYYLKIILIKASIDIKTEYYYLPSKTIANNIVKKLKEE